MDTLIPLVILTRKEFRILTTDCSIVGDGLMQCHFRHFKILKLWPFPNHVFQVIVLVTNLRVLLSGILSPCLDHYPEARKF